jgi:hypothetical protein
MIKDIVYIIDILNLDNIEKIEKYIRETFNVKFVAYDQFKLKIIFCNILSEYEENMLFNSINTIENI